MNECPAAKVIRLLGGHEKVADLLGLSLVQVRRWEYAADRGGYDGQVPMRHVRRVLEIAQEQNVALTPLDVMPWLRGRLPATKKRAV